MYENFYNFTEKPFSLTPDPKFFFFSKDHVEAIEHLLYGIMEGEGFLMLVGEVGTGKTTISRYLMEKLENEIYTSLVLNPFLDFYQLMQNILSDFGLLPMGDTKKELIEQLKEYLLNDIGPKGKRALIIIDEAQDLSKQTLEELRVISNIETNKEKLLQILLLGQKELLTKLQDNDLRQLNQRISIRYYLNPLKKNEISGYISNRLNVGSPKQSIQFTKGAINKLYSYSKGIPRKINMLANRALISGFILESHTIKKSMIKRAQSSLFGEKYHRIKKNGKRAGLKRRPLNELNL